jgi:Ca2+-binding EF-hand superfamily protein
LERETHFNHHDLVALKKRFAAVSFDDGFLARAWQLAQLPELSLFPLIGRTLNHFNPDNSGELTFDEFARAMSALSGRATLEEKLRFTFDIFDPNGDGSMQSTELFTLLCTLVGNRHNHENLQRIVDGYMGRCPAGITFEVFQEFFDVSDLTKLTLNVL